MTSPFRKTRKPAPAVHRIVIADDHPIVRDGLSVILSSMENIAIVGEAEDGEEALARFRELRPDLLVLDLRLPGLDGLDVLRRILSESPDARILVITTYDTDEDIFQSLKAGAKGYLLKDSPRQMIMEAVREILRGGTYTPAQVTTRLVQRLQASALTERELDVVRLMAEGLGNKEIAARLYVSDGTVKSHVQSILAKLGATSRAHAITLARKRGYL